MESVLSPAKKKAGSSRDMGGRFLGLREDLDQRRLRQRAPTAKKVQLETQGLLRQQQRSEPEPDARPRGLRAFGANVLAGSLAA
jgi:hypothetical protein